MKRDYFKNQRLKKLLTLLTDKKVYGVRCSDHEPDCFQCKHWEAVDLLVSVLKRTCYAPKCTKKVYSIGLCNKHYNRFHKGQTLDDRKFVRPTNRGKELPKYCYDNKCNHPGPRKAGDLCLRCYNRLAQRRSRNKRIR